LSADGLPDFFISYNKADRAWAEWIAWQLEAADFSVYVQAWDMLPGNNFVERMQFGTAKAERTIAVLSPDYLTSSFTQPEWYAAFAKDPTGAKGILLPVRIRECALEGLLPQLIYLDLVDVEESRAGELIIAAARKERSKPQTAPAFPGGIATHPAAKRPRYPGTLPPIWNVPFHRNPNFTGRGQLLDELRTALTSGGSAAVVQAIHGTGGAGKTSIAVEFIYRNLPDYVAVCWVDAETPSTLSTSYVALAGKLDVVAADPSLQVEAIRGWFDRHKDWLLVFDNADPDVDLKPYVPQGTSGNVLITSRNRNWRGIATTVSVDVWLLPECVEYLTKLLSAADKSDSEKLAGEL